MAFTQNGTTFSSVKTAGVETDQWPLILFGRQGPDSDGGVINAVDIDWNGAELELPDALGGGTEIINTTGQLFRRL